MTITCSSWRYSTRLGLQRHFASSRDRRTTLHQNKRVHKRDCRSATVEERGSLSADDPNGSWTTDEKVEASSRDNVAESKYFGKKALVIGAGPAGLVAAAYLARQGFSVKVYEKRDDASVVAPSDYRSRAIRLRDSSVRILTDVAGVEFPQPPDVYINGICRAIGAGRITPTKVMYRDLESRDHPQFICNRNDITKSITDGVIERYSNQIDLHYKCECKRIDFDNRVAEFANGDGQNFTEDYDLLVAADGAHSVVRSELMKVDKRLTASETKNKRAYKYITGLSWLNDNSDEMKQSQAGWSLGGLFPVNLSSGDGEKSVYVIINQYKPGRVFMTLTSTHQEVLDRIDKDALCKSLPSYFPQVWIDEIAEGVKSAPLSNSPPVIRLSKIYGPRTVIIGDAGHTVTAEMGIGANMAISDGKELSLALDEADGDLDALPRTFHRRRFSTVRSLQRLQMSVASSSMELTGVDVVLAKIVGIHQWICSKGHKLLPRLIPLPLQQQLHLDEISYVKVLHRIYQDIIAAAGAIKAS